MSERTTTLPADPVTDLVRQIDASNHAWKLAQDMFGAETPLAVSLRERKTALQVRLLREHPGDVRLERDAALGEQAVYGILLRTACGNRENAAHIPIDTAQARLSAEELRRVLPGGDA